RTVCSFVKITMIDPRHNCPLVWAPEIRRDGLMLESAGVGLPVLFRAIWEPDLIWLSKVYGDSRDNLLVIASQEGDDVLTSLNCPAVAGVVTRFIGDTYQLREFEATNDVTAYFGVDDDSREIAGLPATGPWLLTSHDEHWSTLYLVDDASTSRVLEG